jgi:hypothetical protein
MERSNHTDAQGGSANALRWQKRIEGPRRQTAAISEETRPEETTTEKHGKCYQDLQEVHWTGNCRVNCQIYCWATKNQRLDLVERSTTSKMEKATAGRAGVGNVEAPAPTARERERERERC